MIPDEAIAAGLAAWGQWPVGVSPKRQMINILEAAAPHLNKPHTIITAEELDALRFQAVILDAYGTPYVCERHRTDGTRNEWRPAGMNHLDESDTILYHGPATVVHEGEPTP